MFKLEDVTSLGNDYDQDNDRAFGAFTPLCPPGSLW